MCVLTLILQDNKGYTALTIACQNGCADLARVLLDKGAAVDHKTKVWCEYLTGLLLSKWRFQLCLYIMSGSGLHDTQTNNMHPDVVICRREIHHYLLRVSIITLKLWRSCWNMELQLTYRLT